MLAKLALAAALAVPAAASFLRAAPPPLRLDPADSWLVYAKAAGNGKRVLSVNASWVVPAYPTTRGGGNAPGWWFGIEPVPADVLIQPILVRFRNLPAPRTTPTNRNPLNRPVRRRRTATACLTTVSKIFCAKPAQLSR